MLSYKWRLFARGALFMSVLLVSTARILLFLWWSFFRSMKKSVSSHFFISFGAKKIKIKSKRTISVLLVLVK